MRVTKLNYIIRKDIKDSENRGRFNSTSKENEGNKERYKERITKIKS